MKTKHSLNNDPLVINVYLIAKLPEKAMSTK